jgi:hypothetical protein
LERDENLMVGQWETFLRQARRAGASDDTPVAEVMHDGTDVLCAYRVAVTDSQGAAPEQVTIPASLVHDLLSVVAEVAKSDGDVRGLESGAQTALQSTYDYLLAPVLGGNPNSSRSGEASDV